MKYYQYLLFGVLSAAAVLPATANVATTAGSNFTAYNGTGAMNNNKWNSLMNARGGMGDTVAEANFGNCNAVVLRCASPKCANGACNDVSLARPIVAGCVNSNASCKKHGDDLIDYITAQVVAQSTAKIREQENAVAIAQAQAQAQAAAAEQSNSQMQAMAEQMASIQAQMAESMAAMQEQISAQSESQSAQIQSALEEQRNNSVPALISNTADTPGDAAAIAAGMEGMSVAEQLAIKNNIDPDIVVREQIGGQIQTAIDNATTEMKKLKTILDTLLEYAGCDAAATSCTGPKRVKKFKDLANEFFEPYEAVVDEMYDALMIAMTLGIDISDVVMLLSDSCNIWGKYLCGTCGQSEYDASHGSDSDKEYIAQNGVCECNDTSDGKYSGCYWRVATADGKVAKNQRHCRLVGTLTEKDTIYREWIDANTGVSGATQVACASDYIGSVGIFRGRRKNATMDIELIRDLVNQDSRACRGKMEGNEFKLSPDPDADKACWLNRCAVEQDSELYNVLRNAADTRKLPTKKGVKSKSNLNALCYADEQYIPDGNLTTVKAKTCYSGQLLNDQGECVDDPSFIGPPVLFGL